MDLDQPCLVKSDQPDHSLSASVSPFVSPALRLCLREKKQPVGPLKVNLLIKAQQQLLK